MVPSKKPLNPDSKAHEAIVSIGESADFVQKIRWGIKFVAVAWDNAAAYEAHIDFYFSMGSDPIEDRQSFLAGWRRA